MTTIQRFFYKNKTNNQDPFYYKNYANKFNRFGKKITERDLVDLESQLGASIFGQPPNKTTRKFFNVDENSWIWFEEKIGKNGAKSETYIRYEVTAEKIIKVESGPRYKVLEGTELDNFRKAVTAYHKIVLGRIYNQ